MQFRCTYKYTEPPLYIPDTRTLYIYIFEDTNHGLTNLRDSFEYKIDSSPPCWGRPPRPSAPAWLVSSAGCSCWSSGGSCSCAPRAGRPWWDSVWRTWRTEWTGESPDVWGRCPLSACPPRPPPSSPPPESPGTWRTWASCCWRHSAEEAPSSPPPRWSSWWEKRELSVWNIVNLSAKVRGGWRVRGVGNSDQLWVPLSSLAELDLKLRPGRRYRSEQCVQLHNAGTSLSSLACRLTDTFPCLHWERTELSLSCSLTVASKPSECADDAITV